MKMHGETIKLFMYLTQLIVLYNVWLHVSASYIVIHVHEWPEDDKL